MNEENDEMQAEAVTVYTPAAHYPSPDQLAEYRRQESLRMAISLRAPGHSASEAVLADAKLFDAFITGSE